MQGPYIIEQQGFRGATVPALRNAHEMQFGPALAVIFGFLLTAGKAGTGLPRREVLRWRLCAAWAAAFGLHLWVFAPWRVNARQDGRDG